MTPPLVGFITPPDWYDPSPVEFHALMNGQVRVQQCILNLPGFEYRIESIACSESEQIGAARLLAGAGCDLIASVGTPFAWAGLGSVEAARERCGRLTQASGVSNIMTGIAIVDALRHLGIERVGLACTYYSDAWKTQWGDYIRASGFEVAAHNFVDDGFMPEDDVISSEFWTPDPARIRESVMNLHRASRELEAIAISGAGSRTLALVPDLKSELDIPVIGSDTALYWAITQTLGLEAEGLI